MPIEDERIQHLLNDSQPGESRGGPHSEVPTAIPAVVQQESRKAGDGTAPFPVIPLDLLQVLTERFPHRPYVPGVSFDAVAYDAGQRSVIDYLIAEYNYQQLPVTPETKT